MARKHTERTPSPGALAPLLREAAQALAETHQELASRLTAAALAETTPLKGLSVPRFLAIVAPLLPTLALPPPEMRTQGKGGWYGKIGMLLKRSGLTEELAAELARKVASWSTMDMPVETLITRAATYLSAPDPDGQAKKPRAGLGPRPMFTDEELSTDE